MSVEELLERIPSPELSEWMAYFAIEPFGPLRDDLHAGTIAATTANAAWGKKSKSWSPEDFFPNLVDQVERRPQTPQEMKDAMERVAIIFNAVHAQGQPNG